MIRKNDPQTIAPYLKDASNFSGGYADEVVIPETTVELVQFLQSNKLPVTVAGAGTGLTASRIPDQGVIVSMEKFNTIGEIDNASIDVGPAVSLKDLNDHLQESSGFYYPPNPTETLAWFGGMVATNASGSRSYKLGVTGRYPRLCSGSGHCSGRWKNTDPWQGKNYQRTVDTGRWYGGHFSGD
jgi:FAD/FMN-containing dehydrogenase